MCLCISFHICALFICAPITFAHRLSAFRHELKMDRQLTVVNILSHRKLVSLDVNFRLKNFTVHSVSQVF